MRVNFRILVVDLMVEAAFQPRIVLTPVVEIAAGLRRAQSSRKPLPQTIRIGDYSATTSSPAGRDFAMLNLLICGKLENRST
jgi:hypothetical protein